MKRSLIALALAAIVPFAAQADDKLSYTYVEGTYLNTQADGDIDADGFGVRGSFEFGDSGFYGLGGYNMVEIDDVNVDVDNYEIGVGYGHGLSDNLDLISELAYINSDVTVYLHREPVTDWIGFDVVNHGATDGVAIGERFLHDEQGPIGTASCTALAQKRKV